MEMDINRLTWKLTAGGAAVLAGMATRSLLKKAGGASKKSIRRIIPSRRTFPGGTPCSGRH